MQQQLDNIEKKVNTMYEGFVGNEFNEGLISEVKKNSTHRRNSVKTNGFIAGSSIVFGGLLGKFWDGIVNIFI
jgi:hypothetical protein